MVSIGLANMLATAGLVGSTQQDDEIIPLLHRLGGPTYIMVMATSTTEADILRTLVFPFDEDLDPPAARSLLRIRFDRAATKQINQLLRKNQRGVISAEERLVLEKYIRMGKSIDVLQAKARKALKGAAQAG